MTTEEVRLEEVSKYTLESFLKSDGKHKFGDPNKIFIYGPDDSVVNRVIAYMRGYLAGRIINADSETAISLGNVSVLRGSREDGYSVDLGASLFNISNL